MIKSHQKLLALILAFAATAWAYPIKCSGAAPIIATTLGSFEGQEEPVVIVEPTGLPPPNDFNYTHGDTYDNMIDKGNGVFRFRLRYYANDWWDGDRDNEDGSRQRAEVKGIGATSNRQQTNETFEYSYDWQINPEFITPDRFTDIFQLKANDGDSGGPLITLNLDASPGVALVQLACTDGNTQQVRTVNYTPGQWQHIVIRVTTSASTESTGSVLASFNGDNFTGLTNLPVYRTGSTTYRPKWGFYRSTESSAYHNGEDWVEDKNVWLLKNATTRWLKWKGDGSTNAWNVDAASNWLDGASASVFSNYDQVTFDDSATNISVNLVSTVTPGYITVSNPTKNYTFSGSGKISGGTTLTKKGAGTLTINTANDYTGETNVTAGVLKAGSATALGSAVSGTTVNGGTLDVNGNALGAEPIIVKGVGVGSGGAIINSGASQTNALRNVTISGNVNFGGTGRWDIRGAGATLSTGGQSYNIVKVGTNQVSLAGTAVDPTLGAININQGVLSFQSTTSSMGDQSKTVTVLSAGKLGFYDTTTVMNKKVVLNGGTIWAESGTGANNTFAGPIALSIFGGTLDAGSALTGGTPNASAVLTLTGAISGPTALTKNGPGAVTLSGINIYSGGTIIKGSGSLSVSDNVNLGAAAGSVTFDGGKLAATGNVVMARPITITANGGGINTAGNAVTLAGSQNTAWGAGALTVDGATGGKLLFNRTGGTVSVDPNAILQINPGASVELTGTPATYAGTNFLKIINNSADSLLVSGIDQKVGDISGAGSTVLLDGASLSAKSIDQNTVKLGAGAKLSLAPLPGGPFAGIMTPVPEPAVWTMLLLAVLGMGIYYRRGH